MVLGKRDYAEYSFQISQNALKISGSTNPGSLIMSRKKTRLISGLALLPYSVAAIKI
jgi:hypothetical protein